MLRSLCRLFFAEMAKVWRTKFPYLGLLSSALMAVIARQSVETMAQPSEITGPNYFTASINMTTTIIIPIFATIFASMLVASEASRGTLRTILTRPVTRFEFLTAKLLTGVAYLGLLFLANVIVAVPIAGNYPLQTGSDRDIAIPQLPQQVINYTIALFLAFLPQLATVCFAFFVSVMSSNVATATGLAVGILLSIQPIKMFVHFGSFELDKWLFSSYYDYPIGVADNLAAGINASWGEEKMVYLLATSLISMAIFLGFSYRSFLKRDLNG